MSNFIDIVISAPPIYIDVVMPLRIKPAIPSGKFLKDDGTWANPSDIAAIWSALTGNVEDQLDLVAYITAQIDAAKVAIINGAPGALDDLNKISAAIGDDPDFAVAVAGALALKQDSLGFTPYDAANPAGYVDAAALALKAPLSSPIFTGVPEVPTAAPGTNTNQAASTAFVLANGPTITSITSSATPTPVITASVGLTDVLEITALAAGATISAPTGAASNHKNLIIRIKDNGTGRTLAFNAIYRFSTDLAAPTTTVISKTMYLGFRYNSADTKWDLIAKLDNI